MNYKFDYFKFTIKPNFEYNNILAFADWIICDLLHMNEKFYDFKVTKAGGFYGQKYSYHNIYIKTPPPYKLDEGFEVEMTGGGFDYYVEFMKSNNPDFKIRRFFSDICSLRENNLYKITFTRLDVAIDDISYETKDRYLLNFNDIKEAVLNGEVVTRFRYRMAVIGGEIELPLDKTTPYSIYEMGSTRSKMKGATVYLGSRKRTHCRFYDKIAEMKAHNKEYDEKIKHWVRFEMQFCRDNAEAVIEKLVELQEENFNAYLSEVLNNMVRFIDITESNVSNYYRCPSKNWWAEFIGTLLKSNLVHKKPTVNHFLKAANWIENDVSATIVGLSRCINITELFSLFKSGADKHYNERHRIIEDDYINYGYFDIPEPEGVDRFSLFTEDEQSFKRFLLELRRQRDKNMLAIMEKGVNAATRCFDLSDPEQVSRQV